MKDLTVGKPGKLILSFAIPILIGNFFQQTYTITDSIIVGRFVGKYALAAVGASFPLIFTLISLIIGVASGFTVVISQYYGNKDFNNVRKTIDTLYVFLFGASIIVSVIGIAFSKQIFEIIKLPNDIINEATLYMQVYLAGMVFFFGFNGTSSILMGLGDSKTPLYFLICSAVVNIILDLIFVIIFKMGVVGVALATIISQGSVFIGSIIYLNKKQKIINISWRKPLWDKYIFEKSLKIGLPTGFQQTFVSLGMLALLRIVNNFGANTVAAYTVAGRFDTLAALPSMTLAQALTVFVGQNIGANKLERVKIGLKYTLKLSTAISIAMTIIIIVFRKNLMHLFVADIEVINVGARYLTIVALFYVVFGLMFVVNGVMRGAGDTLIPMFITLFSLWLVRIPIAAILSKFINEDGIWIAMPIAWIIGLALSTVYYKLNKWKNKNVIN